MAISPLVSEDLRCIPLCVPFDIIKPLLFTSAAKCRLLWEVHMEPSFLVQFPHMVLIPGGIHKAPLCVIVSRPLIGSADARQLELLNVRSKTCFLPGSDPFPALKQNAGS